MAAEVNGARRVYAVRNSALVADVDASNREFWFNHPRIVAAARRAVAAINRLPKVGECVIAKTATAAFFREALRKPECSLWLFEEFRSPAFHPVGSAAEEALRNIFEVTYDVSFRFRRGMRTKLYVLPRDAHVLPKAEEKKYRPYLRAFNLWVAGKDKLPQLERGAFETLVRAVEHFAEMKPPNRSLVHEAMAAYLGSKECEPNIHSKPTPRAESGVKHLSKAPDTPQGGNPERDKQPANRPKNVNARMLEAITEDSERIGWNSRQWAEHLKCSTPAVTGCKTWEDLQMRREREKAERALHRSLWGPPVAYPLQRLLGGLNT